MAQKVKTYAAFTVLLFGGGILFYLFFRYAFGVLAPFLFGYALAVVTRKPAAFFHKRYRLHEGAVRLVLALFLSGATAALLFFSVKMLLRELYAFTESLPADLPDALAELMGRLPLLGGVTGEEIWERAVSALMSFLPSALRTLATFLPALLLSVAVGGIAAVYFCLDLDRVHAGIRRLVPPKWAEPFGRAKRHLTAALLALLRSNGILMLIAFGLMLLGFWILRVPYPFLLSAVFSLFDLLPVIGVGAFLVPMGAVKLLLGETVTGVGILLLFAVITVVRQLAEPRLLGAKNGIHPLLILFSLYAGAKLFGAVGLLFFPVVTLLLHGLFFSHEEEGTGRKRKRALSVEPVGKENKL